MPRSTKTGTVYQLKITLSGIRPPIWRRVQVGDCSLTDLHVIIQLAMGWDFSHFWAFEISGEQYGDPPDEATDMESSSSVRLSQLVDDRVKKFKYTYDFGDDWEHVVTIEKTLKADPATRYPKCIAGKRACPPEDCGGPWGYDDFLEAVNDPNDSAHGETMGWLGGEFDSEKCDLEEINERLQSSM